MHKLIFLKRRPSAKRRPLPCPNCGNPIASCQATSIDFVAALYGTTTSHCLRCTLDEVELIDQDLYLDLPPLCSVVPAPEPVAGEPGVQRRTRRTRVEECLVRWL